MYVTDVHSALGDSRRRRLAIKNTFVKHARAKRGFGHRFVFRMLFFNKFFKNLQYFLSSCFSSCFFQCPNPESSECRGRKMAVFYRHFPAPDPCIPASPPQTLFLSKNIFTINYYNKTYYIHIIYSLFYIITIGCCSYVHLFRSEREFSSSAYLYYLAPRFSSINMSPALMFGVISYSRGLAITSE